MVSLMQTPPSHPGPPDLAAGGGPLGLPRRSHLLAPPSCYNYYYNPKWFKQGAQNLCQPCSAPRRHVCPTHIPRAPFERRSPIYPNGILCSSMCTSTPPPAAEFHTTSSNFTWQCLFLRVRGHYGRCARSRVRPGQLAGVLAARYHRRGHPHQQFLLQDDLIMDMNQGRRRGCARSRSRPRTRARS